MERPEKRVNPDGLFTIRRHDAEITDRGTQYIRPFGDVHMGAYNHDAAEWKRWLAESKEQLQSALFIGMGDYIDFASWTGRKARQVDHDTEQRSDDEVQMERVEQFAHDVSFLTPDNCLGLLEGNHRWDFRSETSTEYLCRLLGVPYLGWAAFVRVRWHISTMMTTTDIFAFHGKTSSARLEGSSLNNRQYLAEHKNADVFLAGHDHANVVAHLAPFGELYDQGAGLGFRERDRVVGGTGSFQRTWQPGESNWLAGRGQKGKYLGAPHIRLRVTRETNWGRRQMQVRMQVVS